MASIEQCQGCFSFFSVSERRLSTLGAVETSERVYFSLAEFPVDLLANRFLPALSASSLASLAKTCQLFSVEVGTRPQLWQSLAKDLLGSASCALHEAAAVGSSSTGGEDFVSTRWWQKLVLAASCGSALRWDARLSSRICLFDGASSLLSCCAHAAVSIGDLVLLIGGKRMGRHPDSKVVAINCRTLAVYAAALSADSVIPPALLRHAACEIASEDDGPPRVLVIGGVVEHGFTPQLLPAKDALMLELVSDGSASETPPVIRWSWKRLVGDGPGTAAETPLFHHVLCAFGNGTRVLAWGGDTLDFQDGGGQALAKLECTTRSKFVFILDVASWTWNRFETVGRGPGHRSLAMGLIHRSRLVIVGGSSDPKPPRAYEVGELAEMTPHTLDLRTWTWSQPQPSSMETPEPRTRFAASLCGDWLMGYGGRGIWGESLNDVFQLDLNRLDWVEPNVLNPDDVTEIDACASSMCGNLVIGGIVMGMPFAKADALLFSFEKSEDYSLLDPAYHNSESSEDVD